MNGKTTRHDTDKRVVRTKKAIKNALFKLMETKDISAITICELTAEANVNRRTFYTHYRNLTDILDEIESDLICALKKLAEEFDPDDLEKSSYNLFIGLNKLVTVDFDYYFHIVKVDMRGMLLTRMKRTLTSTSDVLIRQITSTKGEDAGALSAYISGGFFNVFLEWRHNPGSLTVEQAAGIASRMVKISVQGLGLSV